MLITSLENPQIKQAVRLRKSAAFRRETGLFFLEGGRLVADALRSGCIAEALFSVEPCDGYTQITAPIAKKMADTVTTQGVFGVFHMQTPKCSVRPKGRYCALVDVQNPENLGAAARTAEALGIDGLVISGGCDIYHPKALRASMGSLLRIPVLQLSLSEIPLPRFAAVPSASALPVTQCDFSRGGVIVIGNEGNGLSEEALALCEQTITIPMAGRAESLNAAAAAAILLWEFTK